MSTFLFHVIGQWRPNAIGRASWTFRNFNRWEIDWVTYLAPQSLIKNIEIMLDSQHKTCPDSQLFSQSCWHHVPKVTYYLSGDFFEMTTHELIVLTSTSVWNKKNHRTNLFHVCIFTKPSTNPCSRYELWAPLKEATNICPKMTTSMPVPNVSRLGCSTELEHKWNSRDMVYTTRLYGS